MRMAPPINPVAEERFFKSLQTYLGRYIEVITGRNAYTISKEKHAKMMETAGIYLLLEKPPEEGMKQYYDKALLLPAEVAQAHFTTNDPAKIKSSYHLPADKMRFKFHAQLHKIYEFATPSFIVKIFPMATTRRSFKFQKTEIDLLKKNHGYFLFLCLSPEGRLLDIESISAERILIPEGHVSKEMPIDLSAAGVERMKLFRITTTPPAPQTTLHEDPEKALITKSIEQGQKGLWPVHETHCCPYHGCKYGDDWCPVVLGITKKHNEHCEPCEEDLKTISNPKGIVDAYFNRGTEIIITLPEGKQSLVLKCIITGMERR
jgi:uncharacterized protein YcgL (UPF0745 family)